MPDLNEFLSKKNYVAIPISQSAAGHLMVHAKVNDVEGRFILDTGAGGTVVEKKHVDYLKLELDNDSANTSGAGAGGKGLEVIPSNNNIIEIGNYTQTGLTIWVMSLEHVTQAMEELGSVEEFQGIIGVNILKPGHAVIDYGNMTLYLHEGKSQKA